MQGPILTRLNHDSQIIANNSNGQELNTNLTYIDNMNNNTTNSILSTNNNNNTNININTNNHNNTSTPLGVPSTTPITNLNSTTTTPSITKTLLTTTTTTTSTHAKLSSSSSPDHVGAMTTSAITTTKPSTITTTTPVPEIPPHYWDTIWETFINWIKMDNISDVLRVGSALAVIFGGLVPYIPQYLKIKRTKNTEGFSTYVCLTLLVANILRIMFYIGHPFELPLLFQSFVMIAGMLLLVDITVRVNKVSSQFSIAPINSINGRLRRTTANEEFWHWSDLSSYIKFLTLFSLLMGSVTYILKSYKWYVETLGFVAVLIESMLGMPQVVRNFQKKSTAGMSVVMVVLWLSGDIFKTTYFFIRNTPIQFAVCGCLQILVDLIILWQVFWYKRPRVGYWRLSKTG